MNKSFADLQKTVPPAQFKQEVIFAFWFAIEKENVAVANAIARLDDIVKSIMRNIRTRGETDLMMIREKKAEKQRQNNML